MDLWLRRSKFWGSEVVDSMGGRNRWIVSWALYPQMVRKGGWMGTSPQGVSRLHEAWGMPVKAITDNLDLFQGAEHTQNQFSISRGPKRVRTYGRLNTRRTK